MDGWLAGLLLPAFLGPISSADRGGSANWTVIGFGLPTEIMRNILHLTRRKRMLKHDNRMIRYIHT